MYSSDALTDLHERTHRSLRGMLDHLDAFTPEETGRAIEGFGYPSLRFQLHHVIGAERYWFGVLRGEMLTDEDEADYASLSGLRAFRDRVAAETSAYLRESTEEDLNRRRGVTTWGNKRRELTPAHVLLRTQTHAYQHLGQMTAMCRLLGRPVPPGLDFPLD